jgi:hypothetical protein
MNVFYCSFFTNLLAETIINHHFINKKQLMLCTINATQLMLTFENFVPENVPKT